MTFTFHALSHWPHPDTVDRIGRHSSFRAGWADTLTLLEYEIYRLDGEHPVIQAGFRPGDLRLDGLPRADARPPSHPGVIINFESRHGPLRYATDRYEFWQHNIRAIGLGLEALRAVDRYGITRSGEQYTGWRQLTAGSGITSRDQAIDLLARLADVEPFDADADGARSAYKRALIAAHPDHGGSTETLAAVKDAGRILSLT